jgi:type IV pilus assembly protein PilB
MAAMPPDVTRDGPRAREAEPTEPRLGELLIQEGLISQEQLDAALHTQRSLPSYIPLGQVLIDQDLITRKQLTAILVRYRKRLLLGQILVKAKVITDERLKGALSYQRKTGLRLGDALVQLGLVTETQFRQAICQQLNIPFLELEQFTPDPELWRLIDGAYAFKHRVVPIARAKDSLTVAMDDPTDVAVVKHLEDRTGLTISVVTCWRATFDRVLKKAYGTDPTRKEGAWRQPGLSR